MAHIHTSNSNQTQRDIFRILIILVLISTILIGGISIAVNISSESRYLDSNLKNMAQTIASSTPVQNELSSDTKDSSNYVISAYLDSLKKSLANVDVISVVDKDHIRQYHTTNSLIGTTYDGTIPDFHSSKNTVYVTSDIGPSGSQRRAYAPVYDENGNYIGFVIAVMLNTNFYRIILNTICIHLICFAIVLLFAILLSRLLSRRIKDQLQGYEPDIFSAMFTVRNSVLDSLNEGIIAVGMEENIIYVNKAAKRILGNHKGLLEGAPIETITYAFSMKKALTAGDTTNQYAVQLPTGKDVLVDKVPIIEDEVIVGGLCILRDRTEYTKLMEDLSGVQYLVQSMRANNHDFVNKLHVILGLIQMGKTTDACEYITHISAIQQAVLQNIIRNIEDPSVAALLIGKYAQATELNIHFSLKTGSRWSRSDISLPSGDLVTIIGNLLDNAMDSMNEKTSPPKDLSIGIFSRLNALLITIDDTGMGIKEEHMNRIFESGFTTKGNSHGTGMYVTKNLIDKLNGTISMESEYGNGTSITVTIERGAE